MPLQLDKIYETIADKELSFGCKYRGFNQINGDKEEFFTLGNEIVDNVAADLGEYSEEISQAHTQILDNDDDDIGILVIDIIGHSIKLGDYLAWLESFDPSDGHEKERIMIGLRIVEIWEKKKQPIEKQSKKCIRMVFESIGKW